MGIGWVELLIILGIVLVIFGAKRLKTLGGDLGGAIKSFKQSMKDEEDKDKPGSAEAKPVEHQPGEKNKLN
jgi:sec-independent protein translocase protein TatA